MISAIQTSVAGMMRATDRANKAAETIVRAPAAAAESAAAGAPVDDGGQSEVAAIVELSMAAQSYKANAAVVRVSDEMLGRVIDSMS